VDEAEGKRGSWGGEAVIDSMVNCELRGHIGETPIGGLRGSVAKP
jgi:hypothetical protein